MAFDIRIIAKGFFDAEKIVKSLSKEKRAAFSKAGAFVRQRAKTSIRKRKAASPPGQPPASHAGHLRNLIYFAWDDATESVVVGPLAFEAKRVGPSVVPALLEEGGVSPTGAFYLARPYMLPALRAEQQKFPDLFRGIMR